MHATTGEVPRARDERAEQSHLHAYFTPAGLAELTGEVPLTRQVDKTGLLSWKANQYSVPLAYQRGQVGVTETDEQLVIHDLASGAVIARHALAAGKGAIVKNTHHDRDPATAIADLEAAIAERLGVALGARLCARLKAKIDKDQLHGVQRLLSAQEALDLALIEHLCEKPTLTATRLREYLDAYAAHPERWRETTSAMTRPCGAAANSPLARYGQVGADHARETCDDLH